MSRGDHKQRFGHSSHRVIYSFACDTTDLTQGHRLRPQHLPDVVNGHTCSLSIHASNIHRILAYCRELFLTPFAMDELRVPPAIVYRLSSLTSFCIRYCSS